MGGMVRVASAPGTDPSLKPKGELPDSVICLSYLRSERQVGLFHFSLTQSFWKGMTEAGYYGSVAKKFREIY